MPGAVIAIQTFGGLLGYNPHLHVLITDGCFHPSGMLTVAQAIDTYAVEQLFHHKVLKLLLSQGRITEATVALMAKWRHSKAWGRPCFHALISLHMAAYK